MIKKISALVLALMLCLSVVVMPASAAGVELGDATFAIALEWDKDSYSAGETAVLSLYADGADDMSFFTGAITFGLSSSVFDPAAHDKDTLRANSTTAEWFEAYYQPGSNAIAPLADSIATKVTNANTAEEQAYYDWYVKVGFAKNGSGWHENTSTTKNGFYGSDFVADEPFMTIAFTVKEDVADSTVVKAAVTSGTLSQPSATAPSTYIKYFKTPGSATTTANVASTATSIEKADTTVANGGTDVTISAATIVNPLKGQMRYGKEAGTYDVRALAEITGADFDATFGDIATAKEKITEIGFVFASGSNISAPSMDAVKALVKDGTAITGYKKVPVTQLSTGIKSGSYVFSCIVEDIPAAAAQTDKLIAVGYILYTDKDGNPQEAYYTEAQTINFADYYKA